MSYKDNSQDWYNALWNLKVSSCIHLAGVGNDDIKVIRFIDMKLIGWSWKLFIRGFWGRALFGFYANATNIPEITKVVYSYMEKPIDGYNVANTYPSTYITLDTPPNSIILKGNISVFKLRETYCVNLFANTVSTLIFWFTY